MDTLLSLDIVALIKTAGYLGIFGIIFSESGLLIGLFFPGDSLLFTAGFLASQGYLNILVLIILSFLGAVLGDSFGYFFGKKLGPKVFQKEDSFFFRKDHLVKAKNFYEKYGAKTIVLARFVPVVRTLAPVLAGVGEMRYATFFLYNILGGTLWAVGLPLLGFYLGNLVPNVDRYLLLIIFVIIVASLLPALYEAWRGHKK